MIYFSCNWTLPGHHLSETNDSSETNDREQIQDQNPTEIAVTMSCLLLLLFSQEVQYIITGIGTCEFAIV